MGLPRVKMDTRPHLPDMVTQVEPGSIGLYKRRRRVEGAETGVWSIPGTSACSSLSRSIKAQRLSSCALTQLGAGSTWPDEGPGRLRLLWVGRLPPNIPFHPTGTVPSPAAAGAAVGHSAHSSLVTFPCYERVSQPTNRSKIMKRRRRRPGCWLETRK